MKKPTIDQLDALQNAAIAAQGKLIAAMKEKWPLGSAVAVMLSINQMCATKGTVIGYDDGGYVRVRLDTQKLAVRSIPYRLVRPS